MILSIFLLLKLPCTLVIFLAPSNTHTDPSNVRACANLNANPFNDLTCHILSEGTSSALLIVLLRELYD